MPFFVFFVLFLRALRGKKNREQGTGDRVKNSQWSMVDSPQQERAQLLLHCHFEVAVRLRNLIVGQPQGVAPTIQCLSSCSSCFFFVPFVVKKTGGRQ